MMSHRMVTVLTVLLLGGVPFAGAASNYPDKPIRLVVPFAAGGVSDIIGRSLAQKMSELLGQNVIVDNRGGAGGMLGTNIVAKGTPDGYSIVLSSVATQCIAPNLLKKIPYDPVKDFSPIGGVAVTPNILLVSATSSFRSLQELVAYAKANPGKLNFGSSGVGSAGHLSGELLRASTGADLLHIPYKSAALAYPDMFAGSVSMIFDTLPSAINYINSGRGRPIAVVSEKRSPLLPNVTTFREAGFPEVALHFWIALHGPADVPPAIVQKLNQTLLKALASNELRERFANVGAEPYFSSPQELAVTTRNDYERLAKVIKAAGIQPE
jgi:tripartite-type tricarboxylate transporter receptor subunit TctC